MKNIIFLLITVKLKPSFSLNSISADEINISLRNPALKSVEFKQKVAELPEYHWCYLKESACSERPNIDTFSIDFDGKIIQDVHTIGDSSTKEFKGLILCCDYQGFDFSNVSF